MRAFKVGNKSSSGDMRSLQVCGHIVHIVHMRRVEADNLKSEPGRLNNARTSFDR